MKKSYNPSFLALSFLLTILSSSLSMEKGEKRTHEQAFESPSSDEKRIKRARIEPIEEEFSNEPLTPTEQQDLQASLIKLGATGDYAIPTTDSGFKHLLAYEQGNEDIIISFLNTFIPPFLNNPVISVSPAPIAIPPLPYKGLKQTFMDMHVIAQNGTHYVIEMQADRHVNFDERALFYTCATYSHQIEDQDFQNKQWYKSLKSVIGVQVLDYATNKIRGIKNEGIDDTLVQRVKNNPLPSNQFIKHYLMQCQHSGQKLDHLQLVQIELGQVTKTLFPPQKDFTALDWWLSTFKYASKYTEELVSSLKKDQILMPEVIKKAFERLRYSKWNPKETREYRRDVRDKEQNSVLLAVERAEGREEGKIEIALNMFRDNVAEDIILKYTGLTHDTLQQLINKQTHSLSISSSLEKDD